MIEDQYKRSFRTLRLSLIDYCNFQCVYCVPEKQGFHKQNILSPKQYIDYVHQIHNVNPLDTIRLTGGEPTLYPNLIELIAGLKSLGIANIRMTTNGIKLKKGLSQNLKEAGLDSVNISIDAIQTQVLRRISRHPQAEKVLENVEAVQSSGLKIKINCTVYKGINHTEIPAVFTYFSEKGIVVRYLELMNMGHLYQNYQEYLYPQREILKSLSKDYVFSPLKRKISSTANYWSTPDQRIFGIIANHSSPFCNDCDRLRMDSQGRLYGCLSQANSLAFPKNEDEIETTLKQALTQKQPAHFQGSEISMQSLGG